MCGHVDTPALSQTTDGTPRRPAETMGSLAQTLDIEGVPQLPRILSGFVAVYVGDQPAGVFFPIYAGETLVGRAGGGHQAQIALNAPSVSARHAHIVCKPTSGLATLHDLGSRNGTELNGVRLHAGEERPLADNDRIKLGLVTMVVKLLPR
jgi:pSer/pThr/pTyr-binding forkhead associated (FHA) protein